MSGWPIDHHPFSCSSSNSEMLQSKNSSVSTLPFDQLSVRDQSDVLVLDRTTICAQWYRLWSSFGFTEHQWISRAAKVEEYTQKLLEETLMRYKEQLVKRRQLLEQSIEEYEDLLDRTGLTASMELKLSSIDEGLKLKEQEIYLEKKMQDLLIREGQLIHRRAELENQQHYLCTLLNTSPLEFPANMSLSLVDINDKLQDHLQMLSDLKNLRHGQVSAYYLQVKEYSERLEWTPSSSSCPVSSLLQKHFDRCLTADALNEIESTIHQLEEQLDQQRKHYQSLREQLEHLCQRLGKVRCLPLISENIDAFLIKQLEHEVKGCREERMKNGEEYCRLIREQIETLLDKAHLGDDERTILHQLNAKKITADLLDAYDAEYERVSQLYQRRQPVLDAFDKWNSFWNEYVAFTKASTDPGRFHVRGYNAEVEGRKRKKFQRDLPMIEQEFLQVLAEHDDRVFLFDNEPIREKFNQAHQQLVPSAKTPAPSSRLLAATPVRSRTPATTPRRDAKTKEPFVVGTALTNTVRRPMKTPATNLARKAVLRAKPLPAPQLHASPPPRPVHPVADQSLDFSLLHTMKNIHGQIKVMTSTPNSSYLLEECGKTAHNLIGQRKSKRRSKRTPLPILMVHDSNDETVVCL